MNIGDQGERIPLMEMEQTLHELIEEHGLSEVLSSLAEYCFVNAEQRTGEALLAESFRIGNKEWEKANPDFGTAEPERKSFPAKLLEKIGF